MMDREKQIEFIENVEQRTAGYLQRWLNQPEFKAALHKFDRNENDKPLRAAGCR